MTDRIIQTQKQKAARPGMAFVLSLFFTGLGQMYNGDLPMGAAFFLMRTAVLMAVPAAAVTRDPASGIAAFMSLMAAALAITIASPVEALVRAKLNRELPVRAYSSAPAYAGYALAGSIITMALVLVMASFYAVGRVTGRSAGPLLEKDDIVLVYRYAPQGYRRGDLVSMGDGTPGRVVALAGDAVRYDNNIFYLNGRSLPLGYLADETIARFTESRGDVLSEWNEGRLYPIYFKQSAAVTLRGIGPWIAKGNVLVASDTRFTKDFARVVPASKIRGRVEGILFSTYFRKIGMDAFGNLK